MNLREGDIYKCYFKNDAEYQSTAYWCMDDFCKKTFDVHKNYRYYLNHKYAEWRTRTDKKPIIVKWTKRNVPEWIN